MRSAIHQVAMQAIATDPGTTTAARPSGRSSRGRAGRGRRRRRRAWELRLAPLAELLEPVPPPDGLLDGIMGRIDLLELRDDLEAERRRTRRWRLGAGAMAAAAAALLVFVALDEPAVAPQEYVAVATADGGGPALIVALDLARGTATVRPVSVEAPADGSLELWHIEAGAAPRSLGLVDAAHTVKTPLDAAPGDVVAVSLEPPGGSPTGTPTGPVLYSGPIVALE
ncbi:MAG TPA: anti-sigma factor [Thermohalobaculum sp.]|nr:anti-sigma factor [Thermohalobaculum sp.]